MGANQVEVTRTHVIIPSKPESFESNSSIISVVYPKPDEGVPLKIQQLSISEDPSGLNFLKISLFILAGLVVFSICVSLYVFVRKRTIFVACNTTNV